MPTIVQGGTGNQRAEPAVNYRFRMHSVDGFFPPTGFDILSAEGLGGGTSQRFKYRGGTDSSEHQRPGSITLKDIKVRRPFDGSTKFREWWEMLPESLQTALRDGSGGFPATTPGLYKDIFFDILDRVDLSLVHGQCIVTGCFPGDWDIDKLDTAAPGLLHEELTIVPGDGVIRWTKPLAPGMRLP